ncbi:6278_t:CDS:1 [Gigaspora margarita]|uniref:6278_t:CDS:1 n=1 Tax=Gigaspora margarita TaxID=4874 RepID=A0ABN7V061_GIGMA|nr:6278_t:CDS:1 [Gigaspora margarita]
MVVQVSDCSLHATCKYEKVIKLKRAYDESYIESHISNSCKLQKGVVLILNFFPITPKENKPIVKWFSCNGLDNDVHKAYISHVFTHTTHGRASRRDIIARNLFPIKFSSNKPIKYNKFSEEELQLLDKELIH